MSNLFLEAFNAVSGNDFEEKPVMIEEFVTSDKFLGLPPLSEYQYQMIRAGSQIYKYETLISLYGEEMGIKRWNQTCSECIYQLGKGSGKDYCSTIVCAYIVYLLLCLKDPAGYYGKPKDDTIDILNVAVNADQAKNVFFKNLKTRIKNCPWFDGKYNPPTQNSIEFIKNINVYSGHSEREAFEGLNLLVAVLDEISAFALESNTGNAQANTADATYKMYRASVDSRFPDFGKVLLLSFPRFKGDYIQQRYEAAIAEKETVIKYRTLKLDPDLPDDTEGNEVKVEWEEDHVVRYRYPHLFVLRRPTWEVNPLVRLDSPAMVRAFDADYADALGRYACMPSDNTDATFFKNKKAIDDSFILQNPVDEDGVFLERFTPKPDTKYFIHVDLSKVHDRCAVGLAHVDKWATLEIGENYKETYPVVVVDAVRWWQPSHDEPMDYKKVTDYILSLKQKGFEIKLATFDRWNSNDTMNLLESHHIPTELLSVADKHYDDFLSVMYDRRLVGPNIEELIDELKQLQRIKGKVDHPRTGYKDLSDATCGAIFNAIAHTPKPVDHQIEVKTLAELIRERAERERQERQAKKFDGVIRDPRPQRQMPDDLKAYLDGARLL